MNQELGLRVLGHIMDWTDDTARKQYAWLKLMARMKYDGYRDFQAGMRFIESLATWLQQFPVTERQIAYDFVRTTLVYVGPTEMQRLVEQFYSQTVRPHIVRTVTQQLGIQEYQVLTSSGAQPLSDRLVRETLIMGLSDGARIDTIRHANVGVLSNEQIVHSTQIDPDKWKDLLVKLRQDVRDPDARFRSVYLVDDFAGTGSSFLRRDTDTNKWIGKLIRFRDSLDRATSELGQDRIFADDWAIGVHYYVASARAAENIKRRLGELTADGSRNWPCVVSESFGMVLPADLPIDSVAGRHTEFIRLTQTHYDPKIRTKHTDIGGTDHLGLGYGGSALPLVLEHNTPNNSVALLWAETDGGERDDGVAPPMRPLFRRRQRHT